MRRVILFTFVFAVSALGLASGAAADGHRASCPNGFTEYAVPQTEAALKQLPRIAAGLAADPAPYTAQELIELGNFIDQNEDRTFCLKAISSLRGASYTQWGYFYGARDNDTAAS